LSAISTKFQDVNFCGLCFLLHVDVERTATAAAVGEWRFQSACITTTTTLSSTDDGYSNEEGGGGSIGGGRGQYLEERETPTVAQASVFWTSARC